MGWRPLRRLIVSRPTLSLCMIVRDEAEMLPAFLASTEGLWDELVAVDTGSADASVELLRAAGAQVSHFPWIDDFAAARNASLERATGDWILILDPDEHPGPELAAELRRTIADPAVGAGSILVRNLFADGHTRDSRLLRLFRRDPTVRYQHAIHEDASESVRGLLAREGLRMAALHSVVEHHGYTRQRAAEKDKQQRDSRVLRACIERDPTDAYSHFKLLELARFWRDPAAGRAQATEVLRGLEEGKLRLEGQAFGGELVALVARALHPAEPERALEVIGRWSDRCALSPALWLARGELRELSGDVEGARSDFQRCLGATDPTAQLVTTRPLLGLARLALAAGELAQASQLAAEALQGAPRDREALLLGLSLSLGRGKDEALAFAEASGPPADLLVDAVGASGRAWLSAGRVEEAGDLLLAFATRAPVLGIGSLVCDLLLGRNSELDLELDQESADEALVGWIQVLQAAPSPQLQARFWAAAPAILPVFPWLAQLLEDPVP